MAQDLENLEGDSLETIDPEWDGLGDGVVRLSWTGYEG